jgi:LemA protein
MSFIPFWWPWIVVVAVVLCWGVGANRRLRRLRATIGQAFGALAPVWQRRLAWVESRLFPPGSEAARRLTAARSQCALALAQAQKKPFSAALIESLAVAGDALDAAWNAAAGEMLPGMELADDAKHDDNDAAKHDAAGGVTWNALRHQALPLQAAFNAQVERYNRAIGQFPASLLAFVLRFKRAAPLPIAEGMV